MTTALLNGKGTNMDENNVVTAENVTVETTAEQKAEPAKAETKTDAKPINAEVEKLKAALSKANGEAAEYKRQLREKQSEAERAEAERLEQEQTMREELEMLRKEKQVSDYTAKCVALNFDAEIAAQTANALADGNMEAVFDCLKAFVEATRTRLENEALNRQPGLSTGVPPSTNTTIDKEMEDMRRWMGVPTHR